MKTLREVMTDKNGGIYSGVNPAIRRILEEFGEAVWPEIEKRVRSLILELTDTHTQTMEVQKMIKDAEYEHTAHHTGMAEVAERLVADAIKLEREMLVRALRAISINHFNPASACRDLADKLEGAE